MKTFEATETAYKNGYEQGKKDALATDNNVGDKMDFCGELCNFAEGLIQKAKEPKWIPVTEQEEPTENGTYLCHGYWFGSRRRQTETADFFGEWNIANNFILTHWMPLPEPPKGE